MVAGFEVEVEGASHRERFVGSDRVEELPVFLGLDAEGVAVVDLHPVEVLVLQRLEGAFADAVLLRCLAPGADVDQLRPFGDEGGETCAALKQGPLSVTTAIGRISPLSSSTSNSGSVWPSSRSVSRIACCSVSIASR